VTTDELDRARERWNEATWQARTAAANAGLVLAAAAAKFAQGSMDSLHGADGADYARKAKDLAEAARALIEVSLVLVGP
jgi:hypothetical protein